MLTAFDPSGFLRICGIKHILSPVPVGKFNFLAVHDLPLAANMEKYMYWDGEIIEEDSDHWNKIITIRDPDALLMGYEPINHTHRPWQFYPHHLMMTIDANEISDINIPESKPFLADALLGQPRPHRWIILNRLREYGLLDRCLVNFKNGRFETMDKIDFMQRSFPSWGPPIPYESNELQKFEQPELLSKKSTKDYFDSITAYSETNQVWTSQIIPHAIYSASWISIVAETHNTLGFFPTEKTAKCLMAGRIFFVSGAKDYLKNLRSLGFATFQDIIDESYDGEEGYIQRTDAMMRSINDFSKNNMKAVYEKVLPILRHNQDLMRKEYLNKPLIAFLEGMRV